MIKRKGYIALLSILTVMTLALMFLVSNQIITSSGLTGASAARFGIESYYVAESCFADTLLLLRGNSSYAGGNLNVADGYCTIVVTDSGGGVRAISIEANTLGSYFQNISATVQINETTETKQVILLTKNRS